METVGESFKRARKNQKIDLNTVSQDLKISENLLGDIENNHFPSYIRIIRYIHPLIFANTCRMKPMIRPFLF